MSRRGGRQTKGEVETELARAVRQPCEPHDLASASPPSSLTAVSVAAKMSHCMTATFLGTSSGGGPTESRNCSSLVLDVVGDGSLWSIVFHFAQEFWLTHITQ